MCFIWYHKEKILKCFVDCGNEDENSSEVDKFNHTDDQASLDLFQCVQIHKNKKNNEYPKGVLNK